MALNKVEFVRNAAGLGRGLPGQDHISGLVTYIADANLPSGFGTTDRVKEVFSLTQAEALGITEGDVNSGPLWYHVKEYFRIQPKGDLYIGIYDTTSIDYTVIKDVQTFADGKIRQIGVYDQTALATASVTALHNAAIELDAADQPLSVIYGPDISGTSNLSTLPDLRTLLAHKVSVTIGQDGEADGAALAVTEGKSITDLGAILGAISFSSVHESHAWIEKFNLTDGTELNVPAFANGDLYKNEPSAAVTAIKDKGYIFIKKETGAAGTYAEDNDTATSTASDLAHVNLVRVMDKAIRVTRQFMLPNLNAPLFVNDDGTLAEDTLAKFSNDADRGINQMLTDGELSGKAVVIDPAQNVLTTSELIISLVLQPVGVARKIKINVGFSLTIT